MEYLGEVEDVRPYVAAADCLVLPSYREGVPHSLLEGGAMAKPLIAADAPGTREPVEDGVNGFLCRVKDPVDLARKMESMLQLGEEARLEMGQASRRKIQKEFRRGTDYRPLHDRGRSCLPRSPAMKDPAA